jgi:4-amino-4-deoxy-L-arabinose transferase-like glycosyltransferase
MAPRKTGRATVVLLCLIVALGLGLRVARALDPIEDPGPDALAYGAIANSLYTDGSYGPPSMQNESDWSPGAPLLYAGAYYATGGVREGTARLIEAFAGALAIFIVFLLGRRLGRAVREPSDGAATGLLAAFGVAVYPAFVYDAGRIMSEPVAILLLPAAILAFLVALDRRDAWWWALAGALIGLTAMFRPEYLVIGIGLAVLAAIVVWRRPGRRSGLIAAGAYAAALIVVITPWTIRNFVAYDRFVPLATGGGKALYIGSNLPADGDHFATKRILYRRFHPHTKLTDDEIDVKPMQPLLDRVAARHPELPRDTALGKIGRQNLRGYLSERPVDYVEMTGRKVWRMWTSGSGPSMTSTAAGILHNSLLVLGLAGLALLAWKRRVEALVIGGVIVAITAVGAVLLASTRRNLILMPLVISLAATALAWLGALARDRFTGASVAGEGAERPYPLPDRGSLTPPSGGSASG